MNLAYDSGGRLSTVTLPTGGYQYGYTASTGQLATLTAPDGENLAYSLNEFLNTGTTWSGTIAGSVTRTFDDNFRVTALDVDGSSTVYGYDNDALLTNAGDETVTRDPGDGLITGSTLGGVTTAMTYDSFGEPLTKTVTDGPTNLYSVGYTRDNVGRITQKTETVNCITITCLRRNRKVWLVDCLVSGRVVRTFGDNLRSASPRSRWTAAGCIVNPAFSQSAPDDD